MTNAIKQKAEKLARLNILLHEIFDEFAGQPVETTNVGRLFGNTEGCFILNTSDPVLQSMKTTAEKYGLSLAFHTPNDPPTGYGTERDMTLVHVHVRPDENNVWRIGDEFAPG